MRKKSIRNEINRYRAQQHYLVVQQGPTTAGELHPPTAYYFMTCEL